eukprot:s7_g73.t1
MSGVIYTVGQRHATEMMSQQKMGAMTRSRSRSFHNDDDLVPRPKAMPKPLAKQVSKNQAMEKAMKMAEECDANTSAPSSSTEPPMLGIMTNNNNFLISVPLANYFNISPVPRAEDAVDDYRWDWLMQGIGPENVAVHTCRDLSRMKQNQEVQEKKVKRKRLKTTTHRNLEIMTIVEAQATVAMIEMTDRDGCDYEDEDGYRDGDNGEYGSGAETFRNELIGLANQLARGVLKTTWTVIVVVVVLLLLLLVLGGAAGVDTADGADGGT